MEVDNGARPKPRLLFYRGVDAEDVNLLYSHPFVLNKAR